MELWQVSAHDNAVGADSARVAVHATDPAIGADIQVEVQELRVGMTWLEQWARIRRLATRVRTAYDDFRGLFDDAGDDVYAAFQAIHHLRDWLANDPACSITGDMADAMVRQSEVLRVCADVANGSKHAVLTRKPWTDDKNTAVTRRNLQVRPPANLTLSGSVGPPPPPQPPRPTTHLSFVIESNGREYDARDLLDAAIREWSEYLIAQGESPG